MSSLWNDAHILRGMKMRVRARQKRLVRKLTTKPETFRKDEKLQTELRRVAALCTKLGERLHYRLEDEIFRRVHES